MTNFITPGAVDEMTDAATLRGLAAGHIRAAHVLLTAAQGNRATVAKTAELTEATANAALAQALLALAADAPR